VEARKPILGQALYGGRRPLDVPAYSVPEAARFLQLPPSTVRSWVKGGRYATRGGERRYKQVVVPADPKRGLLSFVNLVELHVLGVVRREHRVTLPKVRKAVDFLRTKLGTPRPLADQQMMTLGGELFVEHLGQLVNITREGQVAMRQVLERLLKRVDRDPAGVPIRLYPPATTRPDRERRAVVIDPEVQFGRPCLAGTGIPTAELAERYKAGETVHELADDYGRSTDEVEEAIRYEFPVAA
jgi:uncharacterized protein (DUF433 family)